MLCARLVSDFAKIKRENGIGCGGEGICLWSLWYCIAPALISTS